jgi:predicted O-methyltransferase YrrM
MGFSSEWFVKLAKNNFDTYIKPTYNSVAFNYLEIGTFEGASLSYMFNNVMLNPSSKATVIDPFDSFINGCQNQLQIFKSNLQPYLDRITIIEGYSQNELNKLIPNSFDLIYVDGDHTSQAVFTDAMLSFPLLKSGGIMIFDDYLWMYDADHTTENIHSPRLHHLNHPYTGINAFLLYNREYLEVLVSNWQMIIKKL